MTPSRRQLPRPPIAPISPAPACASAHLLVHPPHLSIVPPPRLGAGIYPLAAALALDASLSVSEISIESDANAKLTDGRPTRRRAQTARSDGIPLLTLDFPAVRVTLRGLTLQHTSGAPAVEVRSGTVVISDCTFANNTHAGAVRLVGGDLTVSNSRFHRNGSANPTRVPRCTSRHATAHVAMTHACLRQRQPCEWWWGARCSGRGCSCV